MTDQTKPPDWLDLESNIPLESNKGVSAESVTGVSRDTLERRYPHLIRRPSPRRRTMKLRDALAIASGELVESQ
jgi:membrane-bound lytic murein transglycosylase MltF